MNEQNIYCFFKKNLTFDEFIEEIKLYIQLNFADPKGKHSDFVKEVIRNNGFDNPEAFLIKYIWKRESD